MENTLKELDKTKLEITDDLTSTSTILIELVKAHKASNKKSRERSLIITKLQEAEMWTLEAGNVE